MKALLYFEVVSTFALILGLLVGILWAPGASFPAQEMKPADLAAARCDVETAAKPAPVDCILHIIADSVVGAFVSAPDPGPCKPGAV